MEPTVEGKPKQQLFRYPTVVVCMFLVAVFTSGFFGGKLSMFSGRRDNRVHEVRSSGGYHFINPLLECDQASQELTEEFRPSARKVQDVIDVHIKAGDITEASVYFRDLNNGPWFGIGQDQTYAASSMLKIAHLVAVYKRAEQDPALLKRKVLYGKVYHTEPQTIIPSEKIVLGTEYTVEDLVERMIRHSDNEALYLLQNKVPEANTDDLYIDLGIEFTANNELTPRAYATFFRVLFNASYLSYDSSERALKLLTETEFMDGLRAGVPQVVAVAHKFGERALPNTQSQLHDCGIVYYPHRPYLLCVMTRGNGNQDQMASAISDISQGVYTQIRQRFGDGT